MVCPTSASKICTTPNHIALHNITQEPETINYPLFLLKGQVERPTPNQDDHINFTNQNIKSTAKLSKSGNFKRLIQLEQGQNIITVQFCCSCLKVTLNYSPRFSDFSVVPLYVVCQGDEGKFQAPESEENSPENACKRINTGAKLLQCLYAEKLNELGFERKTFQLEQCQVFKTKLRVEAARGMAQRDLWFCLAREIMSSELGKNPNKKFLAFLSCTKYTGGSTGDAYEDLLKVTQGHVGYGGDGLALLGTGCLYTWPVTVDEVARRFEDPTKVDRTRFLDDSSYRGDWGGCFATTLGAALHELSHTFDLGHTQEGIMGRGFDDIQNVFLPSPKEIRSKSKYQYKEVDGLYWTKSSATLLNYHKWLNSDCSSVSNKKTFVLSFDKSTKALRSTEGIRVVEVRRQDDEFVLSSWVFDEKVLKYSFLVNFDFSDGAKLMVVAEDNRGNILKCNLS